MLKTLCSECGLKKAKTIPTTKLVDGTTVLVCPACWERLDYPTFMKESEYGQEAQG